MKIFLTAAIAAFLALEAMAELAKPAIHPDLNYLKPGLANNLPGTSHTITPLANGQLPQDCRDIAKNEKRDPANVRAFKIKYTDCDTPWFFCRETSSPSTIDSLATLFGKVPVHTRQWVRHIILLKEFDTTTTAAAYNSNGNIAIQQSFLNQEVLIHESGHSLDFLHAFQANPNLSASQVFLNAYKADSGVPDEYARADQAENVAQQCVVGEFDLNVPGGYAKIEPHASKDKNQLNVVEAQAANAPSSGPSGNLLKPGGTCRTRLQNSPITGPGGSRVSGQTASDALAPGIEEIEPVEFSTRDICGSSI